METLFSVIATKKYIGNSQSLDSRTFSRLMDAVEYAKDFKRLGWDVDIYVIEGELHFQIMMD